MLENKSMRLIFSFSFRKGDLNSHNSYIMHPSDQTSDFISYPFPFIFTVILAKNLLNLP